MNLKIVTIVQARTGSSRLPDKILLPVLDKSILQHQLERIKKSKLAGTIVVATTTSPKDNIIERICNYLYFTCFRGDEHDLLDRHYKAAKLFNADAVVKIPSDCPLIDPAIIDKVIATYLKNQKNVDFVSNLHPATYPDGNDVEIMSFESLETAWKEARKKHEREHTTPYIWDNPKKFKMKNVEWEKGLNFSISYRFTLDYPEDYDFIKKVYEYLYPINPDFNLNDIIDLLYLKPELILINEKYAGVNWYRHHLNELETVSNEETKFI